MGQSLKMPGIFAAFGAWADRGLRKGRAQDVQDRDAFGQEYETSVAPIIPGATLPLTLHGERPLN